jgi:hypothetical protein
VSRVTKSESEREEEKVEEASPWCTQGGRGGVSLRPKWADGESGGAGEMAVAAV